MASGILSAVRGERMAKVLIVVDMQNDFITGPLGTKEAEDTVERVLEKLKAFEGDIYFTLDTHASGYLNTQEGKKLPVEHCISGTEGHKICDSLAGSACVERARFIEKETFGSKELAVLLSQRHDVDEIHLVGVCTDICVISNALLLKAFMPERKIVVDASCCAGVTPHRHETALETMRYCQIDVV